MGWKDNAPQMLTADTDPDGKPIATPIDRRWLWRVESVMAVCAPMGSELDKLRHLLTEYLRETCEHHWSETEPDDDLPAFRQCLWCCNVEWLTS